MKILRSLNSALVLITGTIFLTECQNPGPKEEKASAAPAVESISKDNTLTPEEEKRLEKLVAGIPDSAGKS